MSVDLLFVEGELDAVLLGSVLGGIPPVERRGSKNALRPITAEEMKRARRHVAFIRDRDFDFDPQHGANSPCAIIDERFPEPLGWYWTRHEIENYLLDPNVVAHAFPSVRTDDYRSALMDAAGKIRFYQAARWAIGMARRALPPHYELKTRPVDLDKHEIAVPDWLEASRCVEWAMHSIKQYHDRASQSLSPEVADRCFSDKVALFTTEFCNRLDEVLIYFSGKDLLAGLRPWLVDTCKMTPGGFRTSIRDWILGHTEEALRLLPEWQVLVRLLR